MIPQLEFILYFIIYYIIGIIIINVLEKKQLIHPDSEGELKNTWKSILVTFFPIVLLFVLIIEIIDKIQNNGNKN